MSTQSTHSGKPAKPAGTSGRGSWVVVFMLVCGILGGIVAVSYWLGVIGRTWPEEQQTTPATDEEFTPEKELEAIRNNYLDQREDKDISAALAATEKFVKRNPDLAAGHVLLGQMYADQSQFRKSQAALIQSLSVKNDQPEVHMLVANISMMLREFDIAETHILAARKLSPDVARYDVHLAQLEVERGNLDEARQMLIDALQRDSSLYEAHAILADIAALKDQFGDAVIRMQAALDLLEDQLAAGEAEEEKRALYVRKQATFLRQGGRATEALNLLQSLTVDERAKLPVLEEMAECWQLLGKPDRAAQVFEQLLFVFPDDHKLAAHAAEWRIKAGDYEKAEAHIRTLERIVPASRKIVELRREIESKS